MRSLDTHHNGRFVVAAMHNPAGMKPGMYWYVMHLATGRKVSRYLRKIGTAQRKADKYEALYAKGDRHWPAVTRCDELRDSRDAVPTWIESMYRLVDGHYPGCLDEA